MPTKKHTGRPCLISPDSILDAAEPMFAKNGFDGTTTRQIARAARCNVALIAYHFGGKEGLYRALFTRHFARLHRQVAAHPEHQWPELNARASKEVCSIIYEFALSLAQTPHMHQLIHREMLDGGSNAIAGLRAGLAGRLSIYRYRPELLKSKLENLRKEDELDAALDSRFGALALAGPIIYSSLAAPVLKEIYGFEKLDETYIRSMCVNLTRTFFDGWAAR